MYFIGIRSLIEQILPTSQLSYIFFVDEKKATFLWLLSDACKKSKEEVRIYIFFYLYIRIQLLRIIKYATVGFHSSWTFVNFHDMLLNRILRRRSDLTIRRVLGYGFSTFLTDN